MTLESYLRGRGHKIIAPYLTAGYPDEATFLETARGLERAGADMLEIGIPFSDPLMDGPVIQHSSQVALENEMRPERVLALAAKMNLGIPFVFMTYVNPVMALGESNFAAQASIAGALGVIIPDLPPEEASTWSAAANVEHLAPIFLAAPTTSAQRIKQIVRIGGGFVYCVSLLGVTGLQAEVSSRAQLVVEAVKAQTDRPALVGLGISNPDQARTATRFADGVVVGSAVVKALTDGGPTAAAELISAMRASVDA